LIGPQEWNKEHIGTFKLNSEKNGYYSIKKCGRTANNKLLVLIIKSQLKKKQKPGVQTSAKCCSYKAHLK
jgi:hypothetical protein